MNKAVIPDLHWKLWIDTGETFTDFKKEKIKSIDWTGASSDDWLIIKTPG